MLELGVWLARRLTAKEPPPPKTQPAPLTEAEKKNRAIRHCRRVLWFVVGLELAKIPLYYFEFTVFAFLPGVFYDVVPLPFMLVSFLAEAYACFVAIRYFRLPRFQSLYPLLAVLLMYQVVSLKSPTAVNFRTYHQWFRKDRETFVQAVCDKRIVPEGHPGNACFKLPKGLQYLAVDNGFACVWCEPGRTEALFYTNRVFPDSREYLLYRSDGVVLEEVKGKRASGILSLDEKWSYEWR